MASSGWQFWEVTDDGGELRWLGATRPTGRTAANRATVWTLIPSTRKFIANWFVSEAWSTEDSGLFFEDIHSTYAQRIALDVPQPTNEDLARIVHPERLLTLDDVTSHSVLKVLGKRVDTKLQERR